MRISRLQAHASTEHSLEAVRAAAIEANAHEFIKDLPEGYHTKVTTECVTPVRLDT